MRWRIATQRIQFDLEPNNIKRRRPPLSFLFLSFTLSSSRNRTAVGPGKNTQATDTTTTTSTATTTATTATTVRSPFDIPEIRTYIGSFLPQPDLVRCLIVCKTWHQAYIPFLWKAARIYGDNTDAFDRCPTVASLITHSHHIQDLTFHLRDPNAPQLSVPLHHFPNLKTLALSMRNIWSGQHILEPFATTLAVYCTTLIELHPSVTTLDLEDSGCIGPLNSDKFWADLESSAKKVTTLKVRNVNFSQARMVALFEMCKRVETLYLHSVDFLGPLCLGTVLDLARLKTVELVFCFGGDGFRLVDSFLVHCPALECLLYQGVPSDEDSMTLILRDRVPTKIWPHLKDVTLYRHYSSEEPDPSDPELGRFYDYLEGVVRLRVPTKVFGPSSFTALAKHAQSLTLLHLYLALDTPWMSQKNQEIMSSFPHLQNLFLCRIYSSDIIQGQPWVCKDMRKLSVDLVLESEDHQVAVLERLGDLMALRELELGAQWKAAASSASGFSWLKFKVEKGLGLWAGLKQIRRFSFYSTTERELEEVDVKWMLQHWPKLEYVGGKLSVDRATDAGLKRALRLGGVRASR